MCFPCRSKLDAVNSTRAKFIQPGGDQLTVLSVMRAYLEVDKRKRAEWASDNFVNVRCDGHVDRWLGHGCQFAQRS